MLKRLGKRIALPVWVGRGQNEGQELLKAVCPCWWGAGEWSQQ